MRQRLRKVSQQRAGHDIDLFRVEADVVASMQELLERCTRFVDAPGIRQRLDEPEAAREKRALAGRKAIVGPQFISIQKVVVAEPLSNRVDRPEEPRISGFQKFDARQ